MLYFKASTLEPLINGFPADFNREAIPHVADILKISKYSSSEGSSHILVTLDAFDASHKQQIMECGQMTTLLGVGGWIKVTKTPDRIFTIAASSPQVCILARSLFSEDVIVVD